MKIKVGRFTLCSDSMSLWINEEHEITKGKHKGELEERRVAGYSTSLKNLLRSFRDAKVGGSDAESLEELIEVLIDVYDDMERLDAVAFNNGLKRLKEMSK